jgi:hypothetical protein
MPDISMCQNKQCLSKDKCYRFTATPNQYMQSYMLITGKMEKYENFWETEAKKKGKK